MSKGLTVLSNTEDKEEVLADLLDALEDWKLAVQVKWRYGPGDPERDRWMAEAETNLTHRLWWYRTVVEGVRSIPPRESVRCPLTGKIK